MLAETDDKCGMYSYAYQILFEKTKYRESEDDDDFYPDTDECEAAASFCKKSADLGVTDSMVLYGRCLIYGISVEKDVEAGIKYLQKSIEDINEVSDLGSLFYGKTLFEGKIIKQDKEKYIEYIKKQQNTKKAMYKYLSMMIDPEIKEVPLDQSEAVYYSIRGAEKGERYCMYYYALFYMMVMVSNKIEKKH